MPVVEPVVTLEKLRLLLDEQHESDVLDYKRTLNLRDRRDIVELAKDVGAMQVDGGFIVIGADDQGAPTGEVSQADINQRLFDPSRCRRSCGDTCPNPSSFGARPMR